MSVNVLRNKNLIIAGTIIIVLLVISAVLFQGYVKRAVQSPVVGTNNQDETKVAVYDGVSKSQANGIIKVELKQGGIVAGFLVDPLTKVVHILHTGAIEEKSLADIPMNTNVSISVVEDSVGKPSYKASKIIYRDK